METIGIENLPISATPVLIDASLRENPSEYPRKPYIVRN